jgi:hypothetical protein
MNRILLIATLLSTLTGCSQDTKVAKVIFYNTENLFDTIDDPATIDEEFTPNGTAQWTTDRYLHKLNNISKVLGAICDIAPPLVIGLAEVEHKSVAQDLAARKALAKYHLEVIEQESPDARGIDCALLYNPSLMKIVKSEMLPVALPETDKGTRDIVYVEGLVKDIRYHFFVNHWPSRREGKELSANRRCAAASALRAKVKAITSLDKNAQIIIMGDLNDNPTDSSVALVLGAAEPSNTAMTDSLYNLMLKPYKDGQYTLKYHSENDIFDQIIVSGTTLNTSLKGNAIGKIYKPKWILFDHPRYGEMPNRTYSGPKYHGGFSDHLPVYIDVAL